MRRLPWRVALRADRKAVLTTIGIALGVAFAVVGLAVPEGLAADKVAAGGPLDHPDAIVARPGLATFDPAPLSIDGASAVLRVFARDGRGALVALVAIEGDRAPAAARDEARPAGFEAETLTISEPSARTLRAGAPVESPLLADGEWLLAPADLRALAGVPAGHVSYLVAPGLGEARAEELRRAGFEVAGAPGAEPFFAASRAEVARGLVVVVAFSSVVVALFAYEFLRSEVRERRPEIGVWRAIGMRRRDARALLVGRAVAITSAGVALGTTLATVSLAVAGSATGLRVLAGGVPLGPYLLAAIAFLAAGAAGGLIPAWQAGREAIDAVLRGRP